MSGDGVLGLWIGLLDNDSAIIHFSVNLRNRNSRRYKTSSNMAHPSHEGVPVNNETSQKSRQHSKNTTISHSKVAEKPLSRLICSWLLYPRGSPEFLSGRFNQTSGLTRGETWGGGREREHGSHPRSAPGFLSLVGSDLSP